MSEIQEVMSQLKIGLLGAIFLYGIWLNVASYFKPAAPPFVAQEVTCFPMPSVAGLHPAVKPLLGREPGSDAELDDERQVAEETIRYVEDAEKNCTAKQCDATALKMYRSRVGVYLHLRENTSRNLYRARGEEGLAFAREIYNSDADADVIGHLRSVHESGKIDLASFRELRDTAALLVLKPMTAYRPCIARDATAQNADLSHTTP